MLYYTKVLKCTSTLDSEYKTTESNSITTSNQAEQGTMEDSIITCTENLLEFNTLYKNREVAIHLEFPTQQNAEAEETFISGLKEIYLKKIRFQSGQGEYPALQCNTTREEEEDANG